MHALKKIAGGPWNSFSIFFPVWVLVSVHIGCVGPISSQVIGRHNHLIGPVCVFGNACTRQSPDYTTKKHLIGPFSLDHTFLRLGAAWRCFCRLRVSSLCIFCVSSLLYAVWVYLLFEKNVEAHFGCIFYLKRMSTMSRVSSRVS